MTTQSPSPNTQSGTGNITATIDNGFLYPNYLGIPSNFVHGNGKVVLYTTDFKDKAGNQMGMNWTFQDTIKTGHHEFKEDSPDGVQPPFISLQIFDEKVGKLVNTTYMKKYTGYIDLKVFDLKNGKVEAEFLSYFTTYENPTTHQMEGTINVAGLVEAKS